MRIINPNSGMGYGMAHADKNVADLAEYLSQASDEQLQILFTNRPDLLQPLPANYKELAQLATSGYRVQLCLPLVDQAGIQVLSALMLLPSPTTLEQLTRMLGGTHPGAGLQQCRDYALAWGPEEALRWNPGISQYLQEGYGLLPPLDSLLLMTESVVVDTLVGNLSLDVTRANPATTRQGAFFSLEFQQKLNGIAAVAERFSEPAFVTTLLEELPDPARELLAQLVDQPAAVDSLPPLPTLAEAHTPVEQLLARGLVLPVEEDGILALMPHRQVQLAVQGGVAYPNYRDQPPPPETVAAPAKQTNAAGAAAAWQLLRHAEHLYQAWADSPPPALRTGGIGIREVRKAVDLLGRNHPEVDEHYIGLLADLAVVAGLLREDNLRNHWQATTAMDRWLAAAPATQWATLAASWRQSTRVSGVTGNKVEEKTLGALTDDADYPLLPEVRAQLLQPYLDLPAGRGLPDAQLAATLAWRSPLGPAHRDETLVEWTLREANLLGIVAGGALTTAARLLLEGDADGATNSMTDALPSLGEQIVIQNDLTAIATTPLTAEVAAQLAQIAVVESRGAATVYRFTDASLTEAFNAGATADQIHQLLAKVSSTAIPQPLTYLVNDVARRHGRLRVGPAGSFLRVDDEAVLTELLANRAVAALGLRRIAPTVAICQLDQPDLVTRLRKLGVGHLAENSSGEVVGQRPPTRRLPEPRKPKRPTTPLGVSNPEAITAAIKALRVSGRPRTKKSSTTTPPEQQPMLAQLDGSTPPELAQVSSAQLLRALKLAAATDQSLWIGYVNAEGIASTRLIDPIQVDGGYLRAYDYSRDDARTFAIHRITGLAEVSGDQP